MMTHQQQQSEDRLEVSVRDEQPADHAAIYDVTKRAFAPMPWADGNEQDLINQLRDAHALIISLIAEVEGRIVGQVTFTDAVPADGSQGWYALGPVAVEPDLQGHKIGAQLIEAGLDRLRERDASGCVLVGNPEYYQRFGFHLSPGFCPKSQPADYYQILLLGEVEPDSVIDFHPLFYG